MSKQVLIGLLAVSVLAMWGSAASAFNRINGIIIRHSDLVVEVPLCGNPLMETLLTLDLQVEVEIACQNPGGHVPNGNPGHPTFSFPLTTSQLVPSGDFIDTPPSDTCAYENNHETTLRTFTFPLPPEVQCKKKWTQVPNSELISVAATATWSFCNESSCQNPGDTIEAIHVECADTPHTEDGVPCEDVHEHVDGIEGAPPPPLVEPPPDGCVAHSFKDSEYLICHGSKFRDEAIEFCSEHGMDLAFIDTEDENTSVVDAATAAFPDSCNGSDDNFLATSLWISNTLPPDVPIKELTFEDLHWSNGDVKFAPGEPSGDGPTLHLLRFCQTAPYGWNDAKGSDWQWGWVCESQIP
jgi:hypothetical protein